MFSNRIPPPSASSSAPSKASSETPSTAPSSTQQAKASEAVPGKPNELLPETPKDAYLGSTSEKSGPPLDLKGGPPKKGPSGGAPIPPRFSYAKSSTQKPGANKVAGTGSASSASLPFNTKEVSPAEVESALWGLANIKAAAVLPRAEFYQVASKGIPDVEAYAQTRYGELAGPMLSDMEQLNKAFGASGENDFRKLLIDPGVMSGTHRTAFRDFALQNKDTLAGKSPFAIRQEFSEKLGTKTYFRALKLTPEVADKIVNETGMTSRAFRCQEQRGDLEQRIKEGGLRTIAGDQALPNTGDLAATPLKQAMEGHIRPFSRSSVMRPFKLTDKTNLYQTPHLEQAKTDTSAKASDSYMKERSRDLERLKDADAFLSVSEDKRVALSVAASPDMAGKLKEGEAYYLFEVKLSPLDVVDPSFYSDPSTNPKGVVFGDDKAHPVPYDSKIEGVVAGHIHKSEITSIRRIDLTDKTLQDSRMDLQY
ncbi:hypothetical protein POL68_08080 [Stigmatella sp. ncwal1]|uniref:Uncharacterized protein n=1 Tax=Stigmatella ashevillensis TaxID=2995309 RepID=A0ABT5D818_9BACT|nr:hypothetical protein [Stigmatella ashevillena]MDC0708422.1 hypothetical protein [Stigmatella ashevillena]